MADPVTVALVWFGATALIVLLASSPTKVKEEHKQFVMCKGL